jgi:hypothetical protein
MVLFIFFIILLVDMEKPLVRIFHLLGCFELLNVCFESFHVALSFQNQSELSLLF